MFTVLSALTGCATNTQTISGSSTPATAASAVVPTLKVAIDCGACEVKSNIPSLIIEGYKGAATKAGANVSATSEATLTIKEYATRGDAARFLAGAFAGKDEIKAVVVYQGKMFTVEDYYRNAWLGIDPLAGNIGAMTFDKLK